MAIFIKSDGEIEKLRSACKIVALAHENVAKYIKPGITTIELDKIVEEFILSSGAIPSFKNYNGYPATINASVNEEIVHGIPGKRKLLEGDIISVDIGAYLNGFHGDAARTHPVGEISEQDKKLIEVTQESFFKGIEFAKEGHHLNEVSTAIQKHIESNGFSVVRDFIGHGIGKNLHEGPEIPNYSQGSRGPRLRSGMALAIEPMVNVGSYQCEVLEDNWTAVTIDRKRSAHYENTILVTKGDAEVLTI